MKKILFTILFLLVFTPLLYSATTTDKISYGTSTAVSITLNSLAPSPTIGRCATAVDNTSTLADDYLTTVTIYPGASAPTSDKAVYVYLSGSEDGTNYEQEAGTASPSVDASYTISASNSLFHGPVTIPIASAGVLHTKVFSVANMYGGIVPRKFSFIVINAAGQTFNSTGNVVTVTPITYTNQ